MHKLTDCYLCEDGSVTVLPLELKKDKYDEIR